MAKPRLHIFTHQDLDGIVAAGIYARNWKLDHPGCYCHLSSFTYVDIDTLPDRVATAIHQENFSEVVILDLSLEEDSIDKLRNMKGNQAITYVDHHSTSVDRMTDLPFRCVVRTDVCATEIVHMMCSNSLLMDDGVFQWVCVTKVRDFGELNELTEDAQKLNILAKYKRYDLFNAVLKGDLVADVLLQYKEQWERGLSFIGRSVTMARLTQRPFEVGEASCVLAFTVSDSQDVALEFKAQEYDFIIIAVILNNRLALSLRTSLENLDVAAICEGYGGGGHKKAAGATYDLEEEEGNLDDLAASLINEMSQHVRAQISE